MAKYTHNTTSFHLHAARMFSVLAACTVMIVLNATQLLAADEIEAAKLDNSERIKRLQDITINTDGWYMNLSGMQSGISRSGLQTAGYSALQQDMLDVMRVLADDPDNKLALNRLEIIRDRVENRILSNLEAGYFYATGVYIDMLEDIAPDSDKIPSFKQQIVDNKAFNELSRKFDLALAENRLQAPEGDCASHFLKLMQQLQYVDADKIAEIESRLSASQLIALNG